MSWLARIQKQRGLCALSDAPLRFDSKSGTAVAGGRGVHPLYAAVDHVSPGSTAHGHQIVSYDLNDLKGHLPKRLFDALKRTRAWKDLMDAWRTHAHAERADHATFRSLRRD
jgi:hypothetical protein